MIKSQKKSRLDVSYLLSLYEDDPEKFYGSGCDPRDKGPSLILRPKSRVYNGSTLANPLLKNFKSVSSASIFWDSQGVIIVDYLEESGMKMVHIIRRTKAA